MKKIFLIAYLAVFAAYAGNDGGGMPGGGIIRNGEYLTIGSAGDVINLEVEKSVYLFSPPGLDTVFSTLNNIQLENDLKSMMIEAIDPTQNRQYFNIKKD